VEGRGGRRTGAINSVSRRKGKKEDPSIIFGTRNGRPGGIIKKPHFRDPTEERRGG